MFKVQKTCSCGTVHESVGPDSPAFKVHFVFDYAEKQVDPFSGIYWDCKCGSSLFVSFKKMDHTRQTGVIKSVVQFAATIVIAVGLTACGSMPRYGWERPTVEYTAAQAERDIMECQNASYLVPYGQFGTARENHFNNCMRLRGFNLIQLKD